MDRKSSRWAEPSQPSQNLIIADGFRRYEQLPREMGHWRIKIQSASLPGWGSIFLGDFSRAKFFAVIFMHNRACNYPGLRSHGKKMVEYLCVIIRRWLEECV